MCGRSGDRSCKVATGVRNVDSYEINLNSRERITSDEACLINY